MSKMTLAAKTSAIDEWFLRSRHPRNFQEFCEQVQKTKSMFRAFQSADALYEPFTRRIPL